MKIVLLASGQVGLDVANHFSQMNIIPVMVVTAEDDTEFGKLIRESLPTAIHDVWHRNVTQDQVDNLKSLGPSLNIAAWWPYILKRKVFDLPLLGTLNFHPSLLPYGRGKHPNFWSIAENTPFGVTLHFVDDGIDSGDIAYQREIEVDWSDTGGSLYQKALKEIVALFKDNFTDIVTGNIPRFKQTQSISKLHFAKELEVASEINLDEMITARNLLNLLRARTYPPHPSCWFSDKGKTFQVRIDIKQITK